MRLSHIITGILGICVLAIEPVTIKGNAFFVKDKRFFLRGIDYQPGGESKVIDPLANVKDCKRDIPYFKELNINTIRVYTVDNSANHDECMKLLEDAGIYLILDVGTPTKSIRRDKPYESYNAAFLQHIFATIDAFSGYKNTLGFFAANEVINSKETTRAAPVIKAVVRDMKKYIKSHSKRPIPVGYSAADIAENRLEMAEYFNCGPEESRIDMLGMNDYSWCGNSSFIKSGYKNKVETYSNYSLPFFLSEFGCNEVKRQFTEIKSIFSLQMSPVFSGGLVYEYTEEGSNYGVVKIDASGNVIKLPDFDVLNQQFISTPDPPGDAGYKYNEPSKCPPLSDTWKGTGPIPGVVPRAKNYFKHGAGKPLGLKGETQEGDGYESGLDTIGKRKPDDDVGSKDESSHSVSIKAGPIFSLVCAAAVLFTLL